MLYIQLGLAALCPAIVSAVFYQCNRATGFSRLSGKAKQGVYGLVFGLLAILSTEFGFRVDGAVISARDAAPLCAGLIFGAPAGVLAGFIGGAWRFFAAIRGAGVYTSIGASFTTLLAGLLGAALRKWMFDNKRPSWYYGLATGFVVEVVNMLLVFLINMEDVHKAFQLVEKCTLPMVVLNAGAVTLAMLVISALADELKKSRGENRYQLAQTFSRWLLLCVVLAFLVSSLFIYVLQTRLAMKDAEDMLSLYIEDVRDDINDASDNNLLELTREIRDDLEQSRDYNEEVLLSLLEANNVSEINIIDKTGTIIASTTPEYIGFDMTSGEQSNEFMALLNGEKELVQPYQAISHDSGVFMKYAGVVLDKGGFVQVGYNSGRFQADIDGQVVGLTRNRHVGENGFMLIANEDLRLVSDPNGHEGKSLDVTGISLPSGAFSEIIGKTGQMFTESVFEKSCYVMYGVTEGYYIIGALPKSEVVFDRNMQLYTTVFIEIMVFAALFVLIYFLVKKLVVENIQKINRSLEEITGGNLNVTVDVRSNEEFVSLSDDINSTVHTLKGYIAEAAARIDKELEFAKTIQVSTLPFVFPPYPDRTDFDIHATMDTAKEVGGDFYDFYLLDENRLAFMIADVSGKGISAAMFMMKAKTLIKSYADKESDVSMILTRANEDLCENNEAKMFVTCWMGILDFKTHTVHFANAGHNPPLVKHQDGSFEYLKVRSGFVLAGMEGMKYKSGELKLMPGDAIFLYTDGVTEATDTHNELYGDDRLKAVLDKMADASAKEICLGVKQDVDAFVGEAPQFDDITMLCLRLTPKQSITVDPREDNMQDVLSFVEKTLAEAEVPKKIAVKMNIAADEIYSNIRLYSGATKAELECTVSENSITLVFVDNGSPYNPMDKEDPDTTLSADEREIGGLGIFMVKKTMDDVAYEYSEGMNRLTLKKNIKI